MKGFARKAAGLMTALLAVAGVVCVGMRIPAGTGQKAADAAAGFILPAGNADALFHEEEEDDDTVSSNRKTPSATAPSGAGTPDRTASSGVPASSASQPASSSTSASAVSQTQNGKILELTIGNSGTKVGNFWVKNSTEKHTSINFVSELAKKLPFQIQRNSSSPQVLIYHTHTTECYGVARSTDLTKTVCAVGDKIAAALESAGIKTLHDKTVHDYPAYDGSYGRSQATMTKDLKAYPSIRVTLDIHRDAMHRTDGTELKPVVLVNGKKAAQLMILSGCDDDGSLGFPNWEQNLRLALRLQKQVTNSCPGLARPLDFCARRYNEHMTTGSLLIEVGTDANTLGEAEYSGTLLGKALAQVLNGSA